MLFIALCFRTTGSGHVAAVFALVSEVLTTIPFRRNLFCDA